MATLYTITLNTGMKLHVTLEAAPIHLQVEFKGGETVDFQYDPSKKAPSTIDYKGLAQTSTQIGQDSYISRVLAGDEWIEYPAKNARGSEH